MGVIYSTFSSLLDRFRDHPVRILLLGLDSAGKTSVLNRLKLNETVTTVPTIGFNVETITPRKGVSFTVWDVGGGRKVHALWRYYRLAGTALVYIVDSSDRERFDEAYCELKNLVYPVDKGNAPVVVLANKQDLPSAASCDEVTDALKLSQLPIGRYHVQGTNAVTGEGLQEALEVLIDNIEEYRRELKH